MLTKDETNKLNKEYEKQVGRRLSNNSLKKIRTTESLELSESNEKYSLNSKYGYRTYVGLGNRLLRSQIELYFSNFLYINRIPNEYDNKIPDSNNKFDFKIIADNGKPIYFEIWGDVKGKYYKGYDERMQNKIDEYNKKGLELVSIDYLECSRKNYEELYNYFYHILLRYKKFEVAKYKVFDFIYGRKYDLEYIRLQLEAFLRENNRMPSSQEIRKMGKSGVERLITKFGGLKKVGDSLNLDTRNTRYKWDEYSIREEFARLIDKIGFLPVEHDYKENNLMGMLRALRKNKKLKHELENEYREMGFVKKSSARKKKLMKN